MDKDQQETYRSLEDCLAGQLARLSQGESASPNDIAKTWAGEDWRKHLGEIKQIARNMAERGELEILRKGKPVSSQEARGVIRLRLSEAGRSKT